MQPLFSAYLMHGPKRTQNFSFFLSSKRLVVSISFTGVEHGDSYPLIKFQWEGFQNDPNAHPRAHTHTKI